MANRILFTVCLIFGLSCRAYATVDCANTGSGRFPEPTDTTCKQYTFCVYDTSSNTYLAYNYTCPTTSFFNPNTATCSTNYVCNATSTNNSTDNSTSSTSVCTADGYVADATSTDCSGYIECVEVDGVFIATPYSCPNTTYFNPNTTLCEANYNCPIITFTCTAAGRFADYNDSTCKSYYLCVITADGSFVKYNYTCPSTSVFSPISKVCTTSYTCSSIIPVSNA